jgi:hypothetical protein
VLGELGGRPVTHSRTGGYELEVIRQRGLVEHENIPGGLRARVVMHDEAVSG